MAFVALAVLALVAGCSSSVSAPYFLSESRLPAGCEYSTERERVALQDVGDPDDFRRPIEAFWQQDIACEEGRGEQRVARFRTSAEAGEAAAGLRCDDDDLYHILVRGSHIIMLGIVDDDADEPMDVLADRLLHDTDAAFRC
jgi:hypothetical protein